MAFSKIIWMSYEKCKADIGAAVRKVHFHDNDNGSALQPQKHDMQNDKRECPQIIL
jgi:hypothetical protein